MCSDISQCFKNNSFCFSNASVRNPLQPSNPLDTILIDFSDAFYNSYSPGFTTVHHSFEFTGFFHPTMRVIDSLGCYKDTTLPIPLYVKPNITPSFMWDGDTKCFGSTYHFENTSPLHLNEIQTYTWRFGDGSDYTGIAPFTTDEQKHYDTISHVYTASGVFSPSLIIRDTSGCSDTITYTPQNATHSLPANIFFQANITASANQDGFPAASTFCAGTSGASVYFKHAPIFGLTDGSGDYEWNFGDGLPGNNTLQPQHTYTMPYRYIVSLTVHNNMPSCDTVMYDTIDITGPYARIEYPAMGVAITPQQKFQITSEDTVDFVNNSDHYGVAGGVRKLWDFDDDFAPICTSYSVPKPGATLPFYTAKDQYDNSDHYYIVNNTTFTGKMNCRWSLDSLPRHKYTNWDSVYYWYVNGKTFPVMWFLPSIPANKPLTISASHPVPDPFWQAQGRLLQLTSGTLNSQTDSIQYTIPGYGTFTRYGNQTLPNSTLTFHEYVFRYTVMSCYNVTLTLKDTSSPNGCSSSTAVAISHGRPDAHGLGISGKLCSGANPYGAVEFHLDGVGSNGGTKPGCGQTFVLFNYDSLADRYDNTPCALDGFTGYQGGVTPGGFFRPPFYSQPNFYPLSMWQDASRSSFVYHYGPNSPGTPRAADTARGLITVGLVIGTGCGNPPFCTQPALVSDTVWYHNILNMKSYNSTFGISNEGALYATYEPITFTPEEAFFDSVASSAWNWGDNTITVDSFHYAGYDITNGFYHHGSRRVRYNFTVQNGGALTLNDSLVFPQGLPLTPGRYSIVPYHLFDACTQGINPNPDYMIRDSALMLEPVIHAYTHTSAQVSGVENLMNTMVMHMVSSTAGCVSVAAKNITVGAIDSIAVLNQFDQPDTLFCKGENVIFKDFIRYFRFDNQVTSLPFNPGRSKDIVYLDPPFDSYQYDTINFWANDAHNPANITGTVFNPQTGRMDTIYSERVYWNFGDGSPLYQGVNPMHVYTTPGRFKVSMIYRDSLGHYDTNAVYVNISSLVAKIGVVDPVIGCDAFAHFIDSSFVTGNPGTDSLVWNQWFFDMAKDSLIANAAGIISPMWHYNDNGVFRIKLISYSTQGCEASAYASIRKLGPRPQFTVISDKTGCAPLKVRAVNTSDRGPDYLPNDTPTATLTLFWGDGTMVTSLRHGDTLEHTYASGYHYNMYAIGEDVLPGNHYICDPVLFPDTTNGVLPIPVWINSIGEITGNDTIQTGSTDGYSIPVTNDPSTYTWTVEGGTIQSGNGTNAIEVLWSNTAGTYRVIVSKQVNNVTCIARDTLVVNVHTGLDDITSLSNIKLYPNPVKSDLNVNLNSLKAQDVNIRIYDILGKQCMSETIHAGSGMLTRSYSLAHLHKGVYMVEISTCEGRKVSKLLIE